MSRPAADSLEALAAFRAALYGCIGRRRDALFELVDALLTAGPYPSLVHLSLAPVHRRGWSSLYAGLRRGRIDVGALQALLARLPPTDEPGEPAVFAVDVSVWPRRDAATSPERAYYYFPSGSHRKPVIEGWAYQWIARLTPAPDSWTAPVDVRRVGPTQKPTQVAVEQLKALVGRLPPAAAPPLFVFDAGYDVAAFTQALADTPAALLIRLRSNRCFFGEPGPPPAGYRWRQRLDGAKFVCNDPATWPPPAAALRTDDARYGAVDVRAWGDLHAHVRTPPPGGRYTQRLRARGTVVRVRVERVPGRRRTSEVIWLWWQGPQGRSRPTPTDLDRLWRAFTRRYDLEHSFRFFKQVLRWTAPRVRLPEQADRWTWLVAAAYAQLRLARGVVADRRLPWERGDPAARLTPTRVHRAFVTLTVSLPPVAASPRASGRPPGRPHGLRSPPAPRYPPVRKAA